MEQHDHLVFGVEEPLRFDAALFPRLAVDLVVLADDLGEAVVNPTLANAADGPMQLDIRSDQFPARFQSRRIEASRNASRCSRSPPTSSAQYPRLPR